MANFNTALDVFDKLCNTKAHLIDKAFRSLKSVPEQFVNNRLENLLPCCVSIIANIDDKYIQDTDGFLYAMATLLKIYDIDCEWMSYKYKGNNSQTAIASLIYSNNNEFEILEEHLKIVGKYSDKTWCATQFAKLDDRRIIVSGLGSSHMPGTYSCQLDRVENLLIDNNAIYPCELMETANFHAFTAIERKFDYTTHCFDGIEKTVGHELAYDQLLLDYETDKHCLCNLKPLPWITLNGEVQTKCVVKYLKMFRKLKCWFDVKS